jgi:hypothetical protein
LPLHKRVAQVKSKCRKTESIMQIITCPVYAIYMLAKELFIYTDISSRSAQEILSQTPFCLNKMDSCFTEEYGVTGHFMFLSDSDTILMGKDAKFCLLFLPER